MIEKIKKIFFIISDFKKKIFFLITFFFFTALLDILGLSLIGPFLSIALNNNYEFFNIFQFKNLNKDNIFFIICLTIFFLFVIKVLISLKLSKLVINFAQFQQVHLRLKFLDKIQKSSFNELNKRSVSEYLNIQQSVIPIFSNLLMGLVQMLGEIVIGLVIIIYLFIKNPIIFSFLVSLIFITILIYDLYARKSLITSGKEGNIYSAMMISFIKEGLSGFMEIKIFNKENFIKNKLNLAATKYAHSQININFMNVIPRYLIEIIMLLTIIIIALLIKYINLNENGELIPLLGVYAFGAIRILPIARNISYTLNRLNASTDSINILNEQFKTFESNKRIYKQKKLYKNFKKLNLENIYFSYSKENKILEGFSLEIKKSQKILIKGKSGRGKTTLLNIIMGLLYYDKGSIYLNNKLVSDIKTINYLFAYIPQDTFIINDTIENNICLGEKITKSNQTKLNKAIKEADLMGLVKTFKNRENTIIGEGGQSLSGGQKQKIAIARAIFHERSILVLDEATNALDNKSEGEIFNKLSDNKNLTIIAVSHKKLNSYKYNHLINI